LQKGIRCNPSLGELVSKLSKCFYYLSHVSLVLAHLFKTFWKHYEWYL